MRDDLWFNVGMTNTHHVPTSNVYSTWQTVPQTVERIPCLANAVLVEKIRQADDVTIVCEFVPGFDEPGFDVTIHGGPRIVFGSETLWDLPEADAEALLVEGGYRESVAVRMVSNALRIAQYEATR